MLMISNPQATSHTDAALRTIVPLLRGVEGLELRTYFTQHAGHAEEICRGLTTKDADVVLVAGGDGTVNEAVNGLLQDQEPHSIPALAIIPAGSANVFARSQGIPNDLVGATELLIALLEAGTTRAVDIGRWNDRWFLVNAGFGVDAEVVQLVAAQRQHGVSASPTTYLAMTGRILQRARKNPPGITVTVDEDTFHAEDLPVVFVSNTNPWTYLGPRPVITNPGLTHGLGVYAVDSLKAVTAVRAAGNLLGLGAAPQGVHQVDNVDSVRLSTASPQAFQVDGEYVGKLHEVTLTAHPRMLTCYAPPRGERSAADIVVK